MTPLNPLPDGATPVATTSAMTDAAGSRAEGAAQVLASLGGRGRALLRQFDRRSTRERALLLGAGAALALMLADGLWLSPALAALKTARTEQAGARQALQTLQTDLDRLGQDSRDSARQAQTDLAQWRARVRETDAALRTHEASLVGPEQMLGLLESLLTRHGEVRVRALRTLGRADLLQPGSAAETAAVASRAAPKASAAGAAPAGRSGLFRHGVELELEGSFSDLLRYLQAVEALPQRMLWGGISLKVAEHPRLVLTLRLYTLSRERHWLEI